MLSKVECSATLLPQDEKKQFCLLETCSFACIEVDLFTWWLISAIGPTAQPGE